MDAPTLRTPRIADLTRGSPSATAAWWRAAAIGAAALAAAFAVLAGMWLFARALALLFAAVVIAETLVPVVSWLERWTPRLVAVVLVYLLVVLGMVGLGWLMVPPLVAQGTGLTENAPRLLEQGRTLINQWDPSGEERILAAVQSNLANAGEVLLELPMILFAAVAEIALVLFMSAYWLLAAPDLRRFAYSLLPPAQAEHMAAVLGESGQAAGGYVRGEFIAAATIGAISYVGLRMIGVDYALALAVVAAFGELIPVIGPIIAAVPAIAVALLDSPRQALIVLVFYVALQQVESNILVPQIMRRQADVPPVLALVALFAGARVGGILGALIAIPLAAVLKVLMVRIAAPAIRRWSGADVAVAAAKERPRG